RGRDRRLHGRPGDPDGDVGAIPIKQAHGTSEFQFLHDAGVTLCTGRNTLSFMTTVQPPINLRNWIEENADKFKPPVSNRYLYDGRDFFVMVIKGPNARNDFHLVDSEEYCYQLKGDIKVRIREGDRIVDHLVREGETFFIPPNVPHAPVRPPDTIGVVVERRRPSGEREHVIFYCDNCGSVVDDID